MTGTGRPAGLAGWGEARTPSVHDLAEAITRDLGAARREVEARGLSISATFDFSGWIERRAVFHPHGLDVHGEGPLDTLLAHLVAQDRHSAADGVPTSRVLQVPGVTAALAGRWLDAAIARVWERVVTTDHASEPAKTGALTWRTAGPMPICAGKLVRGKDKGVIEVDMPDDAPWMLGVVSAHGFQIHVLGDIRGTVALRTSRRSEIILAGVPETMADTLVGRPLSDVVDIDGIERTDLHLGGRRKRDGAYALRGNGLEQPLPSILRTPDPAEMRTMAARLPTALPLAAEIRERYAAVARGR